MKKFYNLGPRFSLDNAHILAYLSMLWYISDSFHIVLRTKVLGWLLPVLLATNMRTLI